MKIVLGFKQWVFFWGVLATGLLSVHSSLARTGFGSAVSESQERVTKADIEHVAMDLFKKAENKYDERVYWKSALDLIVILDYYPQFSKMDQAAYLLGNCLYEMGMYEGADRLYRYMLKTTPKTPLLPDAILGLQKIYYQKGEHTQSLKFYKALETHYSNNEVIQESRYYGGQSYYHSKNYGLVPEILSHIDKGSKFYPFGLYTSGLAYLKKKISTML